MAPERQTHALRELVEDAERYTWASLLGYAVLGLVASGWLLRNAPEGSNWEWVAQIAAGLSGAALFVGLVAMGVHVGTQALREEMASVVRAIRESGEERPR